MDNSFTNRQYRAFAYGWWELQHEGMQKTLGRIPTDEEIEQTFTVENLCKNYDKIRNMRGVGDGALKRLEEVANQNGIPIIRADPLDGHENFIPIR